MFGIWEFLLVLMGFELIATTVMLILLYRGSKKAKEKTEERKAADQEKLEKDADDILEENGMFTNHQIETNKPPTGTLAFIAATNKKNESPTQEHKQTADDNFLKVNDHVPLTYAAYQRSKLRHDDVWQESDDESRGNKSRDQTTVSENDVKVQTKDPDDDKPYGFYPVKKSPAVTRSTISSPISSDYVSDESLTPVSTPKQTRSKLADRPKVLIRNNVRLNVTPGDYSPTSARNWRRIAEI